MLVSVIIPNYNHAGFLKERIESVLAQKFQDYELIILDDCSIDKSCKIIEEFRSHPKVRHIVYNAVNSGNTFSQWNEGVQLAGGEYVWIAESDDAASPDFLSKAVRPLLNNSDTVISYCQSLRINAEGVVTGNWLSWTDSLPSGELFHQHFAMAGEIFIEKFLLYRNVIPNASAVVFRKSAYQKAAGADPSVKYCSDWLTWLKMLTLGSISYHPAPLNHFRYHNRSVIYSVIRSEVFKKKYDIIMRKAFDAFLEQSVINADYRNLNRQLCRQEIAAEASYMRRHKKYLAAAKYYLMRYLRQY